MMQLATTSEQTLAPGQSLVFDEVLYKACGCGAQHRRGSSTVDLLPKGGGAYSAEFHGNIGGTAARTVQLSLTRQGDALPETVMYAQAAEPDQFSNVSARTLVGACGRCCQSVGVRNSSATDTVVVAAGATLVIGYGR